MVRAAEWPPAVVEERALPTAGLVARARFLALVCPPLVHIPLVVPLVGGSPQTSPGVVACWRCLEAAPWLVVSLPRGVGPGGTSHVPLAVSSVLGPSTGGVVPGMPLGPVMVVWAPQPLGRSWPLAAPAGRGPVGTAMPVGVCPVCLG